MNLKLWENGVEMKQNYVGMQVVLVYIANDLPLLVTVISFSIFQ